ncbi:MULTISPECIES: hypothetical protein [Pantoea]|uniref:hypothetical protein n=1 Tax=Pantoea TaxID=53335 RepID=UPI00188E3E40|nr:MULTISPECIES: hypothetical protein [Pantoea]MCS3403231.1 hypothetical protein [Pantoea sp. B566]
MTLPKFNEKLSVGANFPINQAHELIGKTVQSVEIGYQDTPSAVHQTEMMIITFTDNTQLAISTGSNVGNVISKIKRGEGVKIKPTDFHTDLELTWKR